MSTCNQLDLGITRILTDYYALKPPHNQHGLKSVKINLVVLDIIIAIKSLQSLFSIFGSWCFFDNELDLVLFITLLSSVHSFMWTLKI